MSFQKFQHKKKSSLFAKAPAVKPVTIPVIKWQPLPFNKEETDYVDKMYACYRAKKKELNYDMVAFNKWLTDYITKNNKQPFE